MFPSKELDLKLRYSWPKNAKPFSHMFHANHRPSLPIQKGHASMAKGMRASFGMGRSQRSPKPCCLPWMNIPPMCVCNSTGVCLCFASCWQPALAGGEAADFPLAWRRWFPGRTFAAPTQIRRDFFSPCFRDVQQHKKVQQQQLKGMAPFHFCVCLFEGMFWLAWENARKMQCFWDFEFRSNF